VADTHLRSLGANVRARGLRKQGREIRPDVAGLVVPCVVLHSRADPAFTALGPETASLRFALPCQALEDRFLRQLLIHPISREPQHLRPVVVHDQPSLVATLRPPHVLTCASSPAKRMAVTNVGSSRCSG